MTVAIAAFPSSQEYIVTASGVRLSHGEIIPAADDATMKNRKIAPKWGMMFAAEDSTAFIPVVNDVYVDLSFTGGPSDPNFDDRAVRDAVLAAYQKEFNLRFFREHLARFGYTDVA